MFNKLIRWFATCSIKRKYKKMFPIDAMIDVVPDNLVSMWNGVNYYGEFMTKDPAHPDKFGSYKTTPWIQIGIGRYYSGYGDWGGGFSHTQCDAVKIIIDQDRIIRDVVDNGPFYNGPSNIRGHRNRDDLYNPMQDYMVALTVHHFFEQLKIGDRLQTSNDQLNKWIDKFFSYHPEKRYAHCARVDDIMNKDTDYVWSVFD